MRCDTAVDQSPFRAGGRAAVSLGWVQTFVQGAGRTPALSHSRHSKYTTAREANCLPRSVVLTYDESFLRFAR